MTKPAVTVLIDTYNHERFIEEAINSALEQDFPASEREILVVDDGSTDSTPDILRKFEPRIRVLRKPNGGQGSAFNVGIPACHGELIAFLDGDDWWAPTKLKLAVEAMASTSSVGMLGHAFYQTDKSTVNSMVSCRRGRVRIRLQDAESANTFRLCRCYFGTSRLVLRSDLARRCLPVPEELVFEADEYLFTVAACLAEALILDEPLTYYRSHDSNLFLNPGTGGERRKQRVVESLAIELQKNLLARGVSQCVRHTILEILNAEATQLRLILDGGYPWETLRTESALYRINHSGASLANKLFRALSMVPAAVLPPRTFYAVRRWLSSNRWYVRFRREAMRPPAIELPDMPHAVSSADNDK
jgi:hypothetical protein